MPGAPAQKRKRAVGADAPLYDLWHADGGTRAVSTPQPVLTTTPQEAAAAQAAAKQPRRGGTAPEAGAATTGAWFLPADAVPQPKTAPRVLPRGMGPKPNKRAAVAAPHAGQSYNPEDGVHQAALAKAVARLTKRKEAHDRFARFINNKGTGTYKGNLSADKTWEDNGNNNNTSDDADTAGGKVRGGKKARTEASSGTATAAADDEADAAAGDEAAAALAASLGDKFAGKKRPKDAKPREAKKGLAARQAERYTRAHRRHPDRTAALAEADFAAELAGELAALQATRDKAAVRRRARREAGQKVQKLGRHWHHPAALDVASTGQLVGSLRHAKVGALHPAQERMLSLEERNLVPARVRHSYNKRKVLKPRGDVIIRRETMGVMPERA